MATIKNKPAFVLTLIISIFISCAAFAQAEEDTTDGKFHDELLNHLVGKWNVTSVAHGFSSTAVVNAEWAFSHQHLRFHFKGHEVIPWLQSPMEFEYYIGYKHSCKKYVVHGMSVFGNDDYEGFCYGYRNGNQFKLLQQEHPGSDTTVVQRFTWEPVSNSWRIESWQEVAGKEEEVFLDMKLVAETTPASKKKNTKPDTNNK